MDVTRPPIRRTFDKAFYDRYYAGRSTTVRDRDEVQRLARFVLSYLDHLGVTVQTVLDAGCGTGMWRRALARLDRTIQYTGIDSSDYLCAKFGWIHSSIAGFKSRRKFDLIVCQDVLQYVDDAEVRRSIETIARLCRGAFYLDVPTKEDLESGALDLARTDRQIHVRSVRWYRRLIGGHFTSAGGGLFLPNRSRTVLLALERG